MDCQVCFERYNSSTRKPKTLLPCGHTFCTECLTKLLNKSTATIVCPKDRQNCGVANGKIEELLTNFAILEFLPEDCLDPEDSLDPADCVDCHEKPQDGPCFPEHCSKRLCSDCKTSHLKKFSTELVVELQAMKKHVSEQQAMCGDEIYLNRMVDQSKATIAGVTRVFDAEKEKIIDEIRKKQEISSSNYFQWKKISNHCLAQSWSNIDKFLLEIKRDGDSQSGKFLLDVKKQITQEKEVISGVERSKKLLPSFDASEIQRVFDRMMPALYESVMPLIPMTPLNLDYKAAQFSQSYGKRGTGAGGFSRPWGVASSPVTGNIAISDCYNHRIHILTQDLQPVRVFGKDNTGQNQFNQPRGVCFSSSGSLFIVDSLNHCIQEVTEDGGYIRTFGSEGSGVCQFNGPCGICWEKGLLYICDYGNSRIQVMNDSGAHVRSIGSKGPAPGLFTSPPWFIAVFGPHDQLVVSNYSRHLHFLSLDGQHRKTIEAGQSPYNFQAEGVMIDTLGQVLVSDSKEGCVVVLGDNGVITTIRLPAGERMGGPRGVTMTSDGSIIVCDWDKNQIHKFTVTLHK